MSRKYMVLCGTPQEHCTGGNLQTDQALQTKKAHGSHAEAFKCHAHYLVKILGYVQVGNREFRLGDGPVRVLSKKIRFGAHLRLGKEGRYMPEDRMVGNRGTVL